MWKVEKPSEQIKRYLRGEFPDAPGSIKSAAQIDIYRGACAILKLPKAQRLKALEAKVPEGIRPLVMQEVARLHAWRRASGRRSGR